jgi:hypothetical protein
MPASGGTQNDEGVVAAGIIGDVRGHSPKRWASPEPEMPSETEQQMGWTDQSEQQHSWTDAVGLSVCMALPNEKNLEVTRKIACELRTFFPRASELGPASGRISLAGLFDNITGRRPIATRVLLSPTLSSTSLWKRGRKPSRPKSGMRPKILSSGRHAVILSVWAQILDFWANLAASKGRVGWCGGNERRGFFW